VRAGLLTTLLHPDDELPDTSVMASPAIYQEYIYGDEHLRVNCFGRDVHAVLIRSSLVDWRADLHVPFQATTLSPALVIQLHRLLDTLGLRMGVFDLKIASDGSPVWLELNAQGQWLFIEALTGIGLAEAFATYLLREHYET
jgi:hypothetical protein